VRSPLETKSQDYEIILEVLSGNRNAYAEIVRRYEEQVRRYCVTLLSDPASGEDAAQEVFIKAYQALGKFRGNSSFSTWLYRIAANHCTDAIRKRARRKEESWEKLLEDQGDKIERLFTVSTNETLDREQSELVEKLFSQLPEKSREVLTLRELQGLSYQEIADALQCTLDAVKARLKRARQELELKLRHFLTSNDV